jgi:mannan endo-1,4-beta-mannosidase
MRERRLNLAIYSAAAGLSAIVLLVAYSHPVTNPWTSAAAKGFGTASAGAQSSASASATATAGATVSSTAAAKGAAEIAPLLSPQKKYLGIAMDGVPDSLTGLASMTKQIGKAPNMVAYYVPWGTPLNQTWIIELLRAGALPVIQFQPQTMTIASIADGSTNAYTRTLADTVRRLNLPIVVSFGHEMNGNWYPWGTTTTSPAAFVKAWQHIHDLFVQAGATNAIWLWDVNVTYPVPNIALKPLYPGDAYVDWIGVTGYYNTTPGGRSTFDTLFLPTMTDVRLFSRKPFLLAETGASPSVSKPQEISDLFAGVEARSDVLGFIWFYYNKPGQNEADWKFDSDPVSGATFAQLAKGADWGFPIG